MHVTHAIHDQTVYLIVEHQRNLTEECGIEPWTFVQKLGNDVFIPASYPHQVRNLKSCNRVAVNFISPKNMGECIRLTYEFHTLLSKHNSREDGLEMKKMIVHAVYNSVKEICGETTVPDDRKKDMKKTKEKIILQERPKRGRKPRQ